MLAAIILLPALAAWLIPAPASPTGGATRVREVNELKGFSP